MNRSPTLLGLAFLGAWCASSCAPGGLHGPTLVDSVRILASAADQPYARPQALVTLRLLAYDGRPSRPAPMTLHWLPFLCENPADDAYYACFPQLLRQLGAAAGRTGADGGAGAGPGATMPAVLACGSDVGPGAGTGDAGGVDGGTAAPGPFDLDQRLPSGDCAQFVVPADAVATHSNIPPPPVPYGMLVAFNIACAGHLELVPLDPNNLQAPPIACFDAQHNRLGADDYVFGFTRVYAYEDPNVTNTNPVIEDIDIDGAPFDSQHGFKPPACAAGKNCPAVHIGPVVAPSSQEVNVQEKDLNSHPLKEEVWAEFFSTLGSFTSEARLLYDPATGSIGSPSDTDSQFQPPSVAGDGTIWIVVHDNRGGATWATVPVQVMPSP